MDGNARQDGHGEHHLSTEESGVFTWDLGTTLLHADGAVAKLFGLASKQAFQGLPIERYIERIHLDDRTRVARSIHHAIVTGEPYHEEYRVFSEGDVETHVMAFGRCFRDSDGNPSNYSGIIFPAMTRTSESDPVLSHIAMAHKIAVENGREDVADALETILEDLSRNRYPPKRTLPH